MLNVSLNRKRTLRLAHQKLFESLAGKFVSIFSRSFVYFCNRYEIFIEAFSCYVSVGEFYLTGDFAIVSSSSTLYKCCSPMRSLINYSFYLCRREIRNLFYALQDLLRLVLLFSCLLFVPRPVFLLKFGTIYSS